MPTTYSTAGDVEAIAHDLIRRHYPRLTTVAIAYVFRDPGATRDGVTVRAKARKISGLNAWLAHRPRPLVTDALFDDDDSVGPFFVLEVAGDVWPLLNDGQRRALVDHHLCHMGGTGFEIFIRPHDLEEFTVIVERHGLHNTATLDLVAAGAHHLDARAILNDAISTDLPDNVTPIRRDNNRDSVPSDEGPKPEPKD